jgi:hypothetical protein
MVFSLVATASGFSNTGIVFAGGSNVCDVPMAFSSDVSLGGALTVAGAVSASNLVAGAVSASNLVAGAVSASNLGSSGDYVTPPGSSGDHVIPRDPPVNTLPNRNKEHMSFYRGMFQ